ncbi:hypothetical protein JHK86_033715 [Glycine max]|nr:hypothetical protein JHK86_033715 [Glycine max]
MLTLNHTLQHELVVPLVGTYWSWMMEFLKGMVKLVVATAVVCLVVALSFYQKLGLELEMIGVGVVVTVFGLVFAFGDFVPSESVSPSEDNVVVNSKLSEEDKATLQV